MRPPPARRRVVAAAAPLARGRLLGSQVNLAIAHSACDISRVKRAIARFTCDPNSPLYPLHPRRHGHRPPPWPWAAWLVTLVLLTGCTAGPGPVPSSTPPSMSSVPIPTTTAGRPLLVVPNLRPPGFVDPPPGQGLNRYVQQPIDWQPCGKGLTCTRVLAPLDYADPDGTAITLALAKRSSTGTVNRGPLFVNPGGPGGSGTDLVRNFSNDGLTDFDLIGWDPRGVGLSTLASCYGGVDLDRYDSIDDSPDDAAEERVLLTEQRAFGASCLARSGVLLEHISTTETVRDLDLLREVTGADRISYLGFSYGTLIGSLYAQNYPTRVTRMVLDGASDITGGKSVSQVSGFDRAFRHFASWCGAGSRCGLGASQSDVQTAVVDFLMSLDAAALTVGDRRLSQQQGVQAVFTALYGGQRGWEVLAGELRAAIAGNGAPLLAHADQANYRRVDGSHSALVYGFPTVRCRDSREVSVAAAKKQSVAENKMAPILGPLSGPDFLCTQWPVAPAPQRPKITAAGAPTILVVGTTGDPATPYEWAQAMANQLDSAVLLTLDGEGHTAYDQSACVRRQVQRYLVDGVLPKAGARCTAP